MNDETPRSSLSGSRKLLAALILAALGWAAAPATVALPATTVDIPDASLRQCILAATDNVPLTVAAVSSITSLSCLAAQPAIAQLDGIEHLTALRSLAITGLSAVDLGPLAHLSALRSLEMMAPMATDASPLSSLTGLTELKLTALKISDYSFALPLTGLTTAQLRIDPAADPAPLVSLPALRTLMINSHGRSANAALDQLTQVNDLTLVTSDGGLEGLTLPPELTSLSVMGPHLTSIAELPSSASVEKLNIRYASHLTDLSGITALSNLRELTLETHSSDISPLSQLHHLQLLSADGSNITDLTPLSGLTDLRVLSLAGTPVTNVDALAGLRLSKLSLAKTPLATSRGLGALLTADAVVDLSGTALTEVDGLAGIAASVQLNLTADHIRNFGPLPPGINTDHFTQLPVHLTARAEVPLDLGLRLPGGKPICPLYPDDSWSCRGAITTFPLPGQFTLSAPWWSSLIVDVAPTHVNGGPAPAQWAYDEGMNAGGWQPDLWDPIPQSWHVEWYRDNKIVSSFDTVDIAHATRPITAADVGHRLHFCITASSPGLISAHMCTPNSSPVSPAPTLTLPRPKVTGTARPGHILTARITAWPKGVSRTYQWFRNNHKIRGANGPTYRTTKADRHKWIGLEVTGTKPGYSRTIVRPGSLLWIR